MGAGNFFFSFRGRIARSDFWVLLLVSVALIVLGATFARLPNAVPMIVKVPLGLAWMVSTVAMWLSAATRRLHDRDKSAWYLWLFFGVPTVIATASSKSGSLELSLLHGGTHSFFDMLSLAIGVWMIVELGFLPGTAGPNRYDSGQQETPERLSA